MKLNVFTAALAVAAFGAAAANAQADELVIKEKAAPGVVVKEKVTTPVVRERITTGTSTDCTTKTVRRTNETTDRTHVTKTTRCD
jgi:hypothetical protein